MTTATEAESRTDDIVCDARMSAITNGELSLRITDIVGGVVQSLEELRPRSFPGPLFRHLGGTHQLPGPIPTTPAQRLAAPGIPSGLFSQGVPGPLSVALFPAF
jgi:hypothetical protein